MSETDKSKPTKAERDEAAYSARVIQGAKAGLSQEDAERVAKKSYGETKKIFELNVQHSIQSRAIHAEYERDKAIEREGKEIKLRQAVEQNNRDLRQALDDNRSLSENLIGIVKRLEHSAPEPVAAEAEAEAPTDPTIN